MDKLNILMALICVMSCQGLVLQKNNFENQTAVDEVHKILKSINEDVRLLIEDTQVEAEEKAKLNKIKDTMNNLESTFQNSKNNTDEIEDLEQIKIDLIDFQNEINAMKENKIKRQNEKISKECVKAIKNEDYELANKYLNDIKSDFNIKWIVSEIYDGKKNNFRLVKNFADHIELPERSLNVYRTLINEMGTKGDPDVDSILQLIEGINKNVISKLPEGKTKSEAEEIVYELKTPLKNLAIDNLTVSIHKRWLSRESDEMSEKIAYSLQDYKLFREISESVVKNIFPKKDYEQNLVTIESMRRPIPKIILLKALYERLLEDGLNKDTIDIVLLTQNAIEKAKENENEEYKPIAQELWEQMQDVKILIIRMFKRSILGRYYNEEDIDSISTEIFDYDKDIFEKLMRAVIKNIYGKMSTVEIIKLMRGSTRIGQSIIGYQAVFDNMKENNHLSINSPNVAPLLQLNKMIDETLEMENLKNVDSTLVGNLHTLKKSFPSLIEDVNMIIKTAVVESNYTSEDHAKFSEGILQVGEYGKIIKKVVSDLYNNVNTERLLDYIRSQGNSSVRINGLFALQDKLNENSVYLFEVAQGLKKIRDSEDYKLLTPTLKNELEIYKFKLPYSIRNAAFGEEIYIKNLNRGGEYLYLGSDKYNFDNERRSVFTWIPGNRVNQSKWILENTEEAGVYRIKNVGFDEYLFASVDGFNYDEDKRRVFSWTRGAFETDESKWRLIPTYDGVYIKNVYFREYLFAGKDTRDNDRRHTFTWRPKGEIPEGKWAIEEFLTP